MSEPALIFDCDGVLIDSEPVYCDVERGLLAEIGLDYAPEEFQRRFIGLSEADSRAAFAHDLAVLGRGPFPADFWDRHHAECWRRFEVELQALDGAAAFMATSAAARAVASSSTIVELARKLDFVGLADSFGAHVYSAELVTHGKPAPDLFLFAANALEHKPADCIVIEDSVNGVLAGVAAGMEVWGFVGGGHADDGLATRLTEAGAATVLSSYGEIERRLEAGGGL
jgi:HAD superfamily hydrolase (TIGR01509 family)